MQTGQQRKARMLKQSRVAELFSVIEYWDEDGIFVFDDNSIGVFMVMHPTSGSNNRTMTGLQNFYKEVYPEKTAVQWSLVSSPDVENMLWGYNDIRGGRSSSEDRDKVEVMAKAGHDFVREGAIEDINQAGYRFRNYEIWLSIRIKIKKALPTEQEITAFTKQVHRLKATLSDFHPRIGDEFDLKRRMNVMLNMYAKRAGWKGKADHLDKCQIDDELRGLFLERGHSIEPYEEGVKCYDDEGKMYQVMRSMTVRQFPDATYYGNVIGLVGQWLDGNIVLNEHYILTLQVFYPNVKKAIKKFNARRAFVNNQARGSVLQWLDKLRFQKNDFLKVNREIDQEKSQIVEYAMQVVSICKTEKESENFFQKISSLYERSGFILRTDRNFALPLILGAMPFGLDETFKDFSYRFAHATTKGMLYITPHIAGWKGNTARPVMILGDRMGQAVPLDFFASNNNYNIYCAATSGAGKSFLVNTLVNSMLGAGIQRRSEDSKSRRFYNDGAQIFIVDVGRSYKKQAAMYKDAQFLEFGSMAQYSLNPFASITDIDEDNQLNMLRSLIMVMAAPSGKLTDEQSAILFEILRQVWDEKGSNALIDDVQEKCLSWPVDVMHPIGRQLGPFCKGGPYEKFFDHTHPPIEFGRRLMVFELEEVKGDKHLQLCVLMCIIMGIQRKIYLSQQEQDSRRRMFILDEAWEFLKENKGDSMLKYFGEFIEAGWRRFRKYGASGCLATQSVNDGYVSEVGKAVVANSSWMLLLKQSGEEIQKLRKMETLGGGEPVIKLLETIRTKTPDPTVTDEAFSEVLIKHEDVAHPCRLYTSRKMQLINTTNRDEIDRIEAYTSKGMTLDEAIDAIVLEEKRRNGSAA